MAHPQIAAFARLANGSVKPTRKVEGQRSLLSRVMHAIVYDPIHDEIVVPHYFAQAILTFRGGANGEEPPIRIIQGLSTQLQIPDRLDVDPVHNEIFVPQKSSVLVFSRTAVGNVPPIRILKGFESELEAVAVAVDPVHDLLVVAAENRRSKTLTAALLIFNRTDQGAVKARAIIGGPKSGLQGIAGPFQVYPSRNEIVVPVRGLQGVLSSDADFVGVWSMKDRGDVPPRWTIGGPKGMLQHVHGVALNSKNKEVIISDKRINAVLTYSFPEIF